MSKKVNKVNKEKVVKKPVKKVSKSKKTKKLNKSEQEQQVKKLAYLQNIKNYTLTDLRTLSVVISSLIAGSINHLVNLANVLNEDPIMYLDEIKKTTSELFQSLERAILRGRKAK